MFRVQCDTGEAGGAGSGRGAELAELAEWVEFGGFGPEIGIGRQRRKWWFGLAFPWLLGRTLGLGKGIAEARRRRGAEEEGSYRELAHSVSRPHHDSEPNLAIPPSLEGARHTVTVGSPVAHEKSRKPLRIHGF